MNPGRNTSLRRVLALARYIEGRRTCPPLTELAREFGVHHRTIRRDLVLLEEAYWPVPAWRRLHLKEHAC